MMRIDPAAADSPIGRITTMGTFAYIARDADGQRVTGKLAGADEQAVLAELQARRLSPVRVSAQREAITIRQGVSMRRLATMYRQLSDLMRAGVPLLRGLRLMGRSRTSVRLASVMNDIADHVADGSRLADAMSAHPDIFPDVHTAMVRAGEQGGFLTEVLQRMGVFLEQQADSRGKVIGNLIYPVALLAIGLAIIVYAMVVFVPKFEMFYARIEIPWPTHVLITASHLLREHWLWLLIALAVVAAGVWWLRCQRAVRRQLTIAQMRIPKWGFFIQSLAVARFSRILGTLLNNGIPLLSAMQISRDAAGNVLLAEAIDEATESVRSGETLTQPLAECGLFPEDVIEMISVGESANNLPEVLITIADTLERRIDRLLAVALRLLEPIMLLGLAAVVLFIFVALIVPMMRMSSAM